MSSIAIVANLNFGILLSKTPYGDSIYLEWIYQGILSTLTLSFCAGILAFFVGSLFGVLRTLPNKFLAGLGAAYVEIFRNIPLLVQFFIWVFVFPTLLPQSTQDWLNQEIDPNLAILIYSIIALGLFTGARICEIVRTAIQSLPRGQKNAALALGLTLPQTYFHVLLPNAYRRVMPPLTSEVLNMIKNSAVASLAGLLELSKQTLTMQELSGHSYEIYITVTACYILINLIVMKIMQYIEKRMRLPGMVGGK